MTTCRKQLAAVFSAALAVAVTWPVFENLKATPVDDFPLSYFPMFTEVRTGEYSVQHPIGIDQEGTAHLIDYRSAGAGGFNQIRRQIRKCVDDGNADELCARVADEVSRKGDAGFLRIEIVTSTYDLGAYYAGEIKLLKREVHASLPTQPSLK
ncbi:MAG: hypothetical protein ACRCXD_05745 [Luteolibacter sp.]